VQLAYQLSSPALDELIAALLALREAIHKEDAEARSPPLSPNPAQLGSRVAAEAPEGKTDQAAQILQRVMEQAEHQYLRKVPVKAEVAIVSSWAEK
jgi:DNA polymerase I-like protein with 3'-5' exonuclease and polymerase domains